MPGTGLECGAKAFEEEARRDDEEAAACHLRHNQGGAQTAHRLGWASGLAVECCSGIIVSNIEQRRKTAYDCDANARGAGRSDAEEIRSERRKLTYDGTTQKRTRIPTQPPDNREIALSPVVPATAHCLPWGALENGEVQPVHVRTVPNFNQNSFGCQ